MDQQKILLEEGEIPLEQMQQKTTSTSSQDQSDKISFDILILSQYFKMNPNFWHGCMCDDCCDKSIDDKFKTSNICTCDKCRRSRSVHDKIKNQSNYTMYWHFCQCNTCSLRHSKVHCSRMNFICVYSKVYHEYKFKKMHTDITDQLNQYLNYNYCESYRVRDRDHDHDRDRYSESDRYHDRERDRYHDRERNRDHDRERERNRDHDHDRYRESDRYHDRDHDRERDSEIDRDRERYHERDSVNTEILQTLQKQVSCLLSSMYPLASQSYYIQPSQGYQQLPPPPIYQQLPPPVYQPPPPVYQQLPPPSVYQQPSEQPPQRQGLSELIRQLQLRLEQKQQS